jgi:hypothetical protein
MHPPTVIALIAALLVAAPAGARRADSVEQAGPAAPRDPMPPGPGGVTPSPPVPPSVHAQRATDYQGLHNVVAFHEGVLSGSVPEGDAGFDTLQALGVRTILSVDGALPDLDRARARGMRYVHLPIGYDGFDDARKVELARAVRDLPRPIYIHCHHGKHRSAGATATVAVALGWLTPELAADRMKVAGTAAGYTGLWSCTANAVPLAAAVIDAAPADFPERTTPTSLVAAMVEIDEVHDRLKRVQKAGWRAPNDHPDLAPLADAGRLADLYRLLDDDARLTDVAPAERAVVREWLVREGLAAARLEGLLEAMDASVPDRAALNLRADASLALLGASCKACHQQHRD